MSRQRRNPYIALVGTLLLSLLVGMFLFGKKRRKKQDSSETSETVTSHSVQTSPEESLAYWTSDKKREASPMPLPVVDESKSETRTHHAEQSDQN